MGLNINLTKISYITSYLLSKKYHNFGKTISMIRITLLSPYTGFEVFYYK